MTREAVGDLARMVAICAAIVAFLTAAAAGLLLVVPLP